jgi:hypothetical protein
MRRRTENRLAAVVTICGGLYVAFIRLDMWVGHLTFWDNFKEKVVPIWRDWVWPMLTTEHLAWVCFLGGIASLLWVNLGNRIKAIFGNATKDLGEAGEEFLSPRGGQQH